MSLPCLLCLMLASLSFVVGGSVAAEEEAPRWWEQRERRPDIYYPHEAHRAVMEQEGDPCLLCHPFSRNEEADTAWVERVTVIANEPLAAICHDCHMKRQSASWRCTLCHPDPSAIWPESHDFDYRHNHGEEARLGDAACTACHLDLGFCTDCHFRRDGSRHRGHPPGYRMTHALDARLEPASCGRCHNARYCGECHREGGW